MKTSLTVFGCPLKKKNIQDAYKESFIEFPKPLEGVKIQADFYFKIPQTRPDLKENERHTRRPSLDSCFKTVLNEGNGILFEDDSTVYCIEGSKRWSTYPRVEITIITTGLDPYLF